MLKQTKKQTNKPCIFYTTTVQVLEPICNGQRDPAQCWDSVKKVILEKKLYFIYNI
jgi:hypothetical protein